MATGLSITNYVNAVIAGQPRVPTPIRSALQAIQNWASAGLRDGDIASDAAIAYTKLLLTGGIVNADISATAAIALAKLAGDGWIEVSDSWTFASADGPIGVITIPAGGTTKYSPGMRIQLTQTTVKWFIVHAVTSTTLTVYGGTDYTLANAAITSPLYSYHKAPIGFPLSPNKWRVIVTDSSNLTQAPSAGTWYNLGSMSISLPIGVWAVRYKVLLYGTTGAGGTQADVFVTLSTTNNSETASANTSRIVSEIGASKEHAASVYKEQFETRTGKASYYLNAKANITNMGLIGFLGGTTQTEIEAIDAYL